MTRREVPDPDAAWTRSPPGQAEAVLLGAPFAGTSGGRPRQDQAPDLLRQALGLTDEASDGPPVWDLGDVRPELIEPEPVLERVQAQLEHARARAPQALPVLLGGEHTVSLGALQGLEPASIVSLDAHPDLWDDQHGRSVAQGTWLRRAAERLDCELVLPAARAARGEEKQAIDELGVHTDVPADLPEPVYLTIDVDVVDPEQAPAVVWPEAGGPGLDAVLDLLDEVVAGRELAGVDLVEVSAAGPGRTVQAGAMLLAGALAGWRGEGGPGGGRG